MYFDLSYLIELDYLKWMEGRYAVGPNHLKSWFPTNAAMRAYLVNWLVEVHVDLTLPQRALFATVNIIDRYLDYKFLCRIMKFLFDRFMARKGHEITQDNLKLLAIAALRTSSNRDVDVDPKVYNFEHSFPEIVMMERKIQKALNFNPKFDLEPCLVPLSLEFLR